jgi:hypothetical protein
LNLTAIYGLRHQLRKGDSLISWAMPPASQSRRRHAKMPSGFDANGSLGKRYFFISSEMIDQSQRLSVRGELRGGLIRFCFFSYQLVVRWNGGRNH